MDPRVLLDPKAFKKDAKKNKDRLSSKPSVNDSHPRPSAVAAIDRPSEASQVRSAISTNNETSFRSIPSYDPRALLNPKGIRKAQASSQVSLRPPLNSNIMSADSIDIPRSNNSSDTESPAKRQLQRDESGQRPMIEDLYGVERRADQPRKKAKTIEDENQQTVSSRSTFTHKSNGIIGEYMKPNSEDEVTTTIDLTVDDDQDDDVQVVGSRSIMDDEVCYGHVTATVLANLVPKPAKASPFNNDNEWPPMKCKLLRNPAKDTVIHVADPTDKVFGNISPELAVVLAPAMDGLHVRTQGRLINRRKKPAEWPHQPCSEQLRMVLNIYGRRGDVEKIGKWFGQHNLWFRPPMAADNGIPVVNPHAQKRSTVPPQARGGARGNFLPDSRTLEEATEAVSRLFDHFAGDSVNLLETEGPAHIMTELLPHQKQALTFMLKREQPRTFGSAESDNSSLWRREHQANGRVTFRDVVSGVSVPSEPDQVLGGLLADVMGLGKTLQALSLVASTMEDASYFGTEKLIRKDDGDALFLAHTKATLIVCPTSTVKNWEDQIRDHMKPNCISYYIYHGPNRTRNAYELSKYDIVIATYGVISSDIAGRGTSNTTSPIRQLKWFRIILDEAHTIREPKAAQSQAIYSLWAQRRWCLTGTPIQNRIDDLGSLTRFLRLHPYDTAASFNQYIRSPAQAGDASFLKALRVFVDSFTLRRLRDRIDLPDRKDLIEKLTFTPQEEKMHTFFKDIAHVQIQELAKSRERRSGVQHHVLQGIMTLRLICAHGRDLLKQKDLEKLKGISASDAIDLDDEVSLPTITSRAAYEALNLMVEADLDMCKRCDKRLSGDTPQAEIDDEAVGARCFVLPCFDTVCADCFSNFKIIFDDRENRESIHCPYCSMLISAQYIDIKGSVTETLDTLPDDAPLETEESSKMDLYSGPHTKTLALLRDIAEMNEQSKPLIEKGEPPIKCIVFSEFTSHLDLIGRALTDREHTFVRIDGSMTLNKRKQVLDALASDNSVTILLASIKAAGQGLNLTAASRAFIMEPMWNPAAEAQAVDRIYRIGQKRNVIVKRYQMEDSIERKIVELQKRKQALADVSMNRNHKQLSKKETREQHMKDILALFK